MLLQQAGSLFKRGSIIFGVASNNDQIVCFGVQTRQKHVDRSIHRTKRGLRLVGKTIEQRANQRNALGRGIDRGKLPLVIQTIDKLQRFHYGTGTDGNH